MYLLSCAARLPQFWGCVSLGNRKASALCSIQLHSTSITKSLSLRPFIYNSAVPLSPRLELIQFIPLVVFVVVPLVVLVDGGADPVDLSFVGRCS